MKILSTAQIREADASTIEKEPISSFDLMERAAGKCFDWMKENLHLEESKVFVFCGVGNNGGDGLVLARLLSEAGIAVEVLILSFSKTPSQDFSKNLERIDQKKVAMRTISDASFEIEFGTGDLIIDAIFGTGLKRPAEGWVKEVINKMNLLPLMRLSIDIPSGLFTDLNDGNDLEAVVQADVTLTFQQPKLALVLTESGKCCGDWYVVDIGLDQDFIDGLESPYECITENDVWVMLREREKFDHKGNYGHALIAAGSKGKSGAAVLASKACLKSGVGLLTSFVPGCAHHIIQTSVPEAMCLLSEKEDVLSGEVEHLEQYTVVGVGPGMGTDKNSVKFLKKLIGQRKDPMVFDADALNILSLKENQLEKLPKNSILTPHPGEFRRLAGNWKSDAEKLKAQINFSMNYEVIVVLKGAHTSISTPDGKVYFNTTGNPGMATAGSGDVLTGIITGLLARGYEPTEAACIGVFLHGLAGDIASTELGMESLMATDIIEAIPAAFISLY